MSASDKELFRDAFIETIKDGTKRSTTTKMLETIIRQAAENFAASVESVRAEFTFDRKLLISFSVGGSTISLAFSELQLASAEDVLALIHAGLEEELRAHGYRRTRLRWLPLQVNKEVRVIYEGLFTALRGSGVSHEECDHILRQAYRTAVALSHRQPRTVVTSIEGKDVGTQCICGERGNIRRQDIRTSLRQWSEPAYTCRCGRRLDTNEVCRTILSLLGERDLLPEE